MTIGFSHLFYLLSLYFLKVHSEIIDPQNVETLKLEQICLLRKEVLSKHSASSPLKRFLDGTQRVYIGSSDVKLTGFTSYPYQELDVTKAEHFQRHFCLESIDVFHSEHTFEHIRYEDSLVAFKLFHQYLKPNGYVRIAVPGGHNRGKRTKPHKVDLEYGHVAFWNTTVITEYLQNAGFQRVEIREYEAPGKICHVNDWDRCGGMVHRSFMHDSRNEPIIRKAMCENQGVLRNGYPTSLVVPHTPVCSLIVDAFKS